MRRWRRLPWALVGPLTALLWIQGPGGSPGVGEVSKDPRVEGSSPAGSPGEAPGVTPGPPHSPGIGTLRGWVEDPRGQPIGGVLIELTGGARDDGSQVRSTRSNADGEFQMELPGPRLWTLRAGTYLHREVERRVQARGHGEVAMTLVLARRPAVGSVEGHVISATGNYHRPLRISIAPEGSSPLLDCEVEWVREEGWWTGSFVLEDIPSGEFLVRAHTRRGDPQRFEQRFHRVRAPVQDLYFYVHDDDPRFDWEFAPYDAITGEELDTFELELQWPEDPESVHCVRTRGPHVVRGVSPGSLPPWTLRAEGYRTRVGAAEGDPRSGVPSPDSGHPSTERRGAERGRGGSRRVLRIPLEPLDPLDPQGDPLDPDTFDPGGANGTAPAGPAGVSGSPRLPGIG